MHTPSHKACCYNKTSLIEQGFIDVGNFYFGNGKENYAVKTGQIMSMISLFRNCRSKKMRPAVVIEILSFQRHHPRSSHAGFQTSHTLIHSRKKEILQRGAFDKKNLS